MAATPYSAVIGAVTVGQVESSTLSNNNTIVRGYASGATTAGAFYLGMAEPKVTFTTTDLDTVLDGIGATGLCVSSGTITVPWASQGCSGTTGTGTHTALTGANGFAVMTSVSARQGDAFAQGQVELALLSSDGLTAPMTAASNASLSASSLVAQYRLGPVYIGGSQVTQVTGVTVNFGVGYITRSYNGGTYPTNTYIERIEPTIDITLENQAVIASLGPLFSSLSNGYVYLQKLSSGGSVVSAATDEHIAISFASGITDVSQVNGSGRTPSEVTLRLHGGSLSLSTAAALP